jgi:hypothetical protein
MWGAWCVAAWRQMASARRQAMGRREWIIPHYVILGGFLILVEDREM